MAKIYSEIFRDFGVEVSRGNVDGMTAVHKFGRNTEVDAAVTADIWDGGFTVASGGDSLLWVPPTTARVHNVNSSSLNDDSVGTGAQTIRVWGLTAWNTAEVSEDIIMDGTTNVATSNSYVIIHRMQVLTCGSAGPNVGEIKATAVTDATVTARMRAGNGQTEMAIYGVPSGYTAYLTSLGGSSLKAGGGAGLADVSLYVNPDPENYTELWLLKGSFGLSETGSSLARENYFKPQAYPGPCIIKMQTVSGAADMDVTGEFDILLIDE